MPYTDHDLFYLIAVQNEKAFNTIYHTYKQLLFTCVKKMLRNEDYAEDIVQDVFIKLWTAGEVLTTLQNPGGWLYRLAANHTLDHLRKEQARRQRDQLLKLRPDFIAGVAVDPEESHYEVADGYRDHSACICRRGA